MRQVFDALVLLALLLVGVGGLAAIMVAWLNRRRTHSRARRRRSKRINLFRE